jgi:hypothetical protein
MEVHSFNASGSIDATIDGLRMTVPNDPANRHRQMIAEWEAEGNTIPAYVPPPPPSPYKPLAPYQFWTAVRATGQEAQLKAWATGLPDPVQAAAASSMLEFSLEYRYDHPFMDTARQVLDLPLSDFQALWLWALTL